MAGDGRDRAARGPTIGQLVTGIGAGPNARTNA
jgi:hypothetical protein